jgi:hypothetical protein
MDSSNRIFVTAGKSGTLHRVNSAGDSEIFVSGLLNPTGIVFGESDQLFILESGRSRLLLLQKTTSS